MEVWSATVEERDQCDQMARLFVQYLDVSSNPNLHNSKKLVRYQKASKIAKMALKSDKNRAKLTRVHSIYQSADLAASMLRQVLDGFARKDTTQMAAIFTADLELDSHYQASMRQLITFMMEDPRTIGVALDDLWVAKAIERVGDHAENVAETVIYIFEGEDVRYSHHTSNPDWILNRI